MTGDKARRQVSFVVAVSQYTFTAKRYTFPYTRMRMELDHEKLDVYRLALDFAALASTVCRALEALDRPTREQPYAPGTGNVCLLFRGTS